MREIASRDDLVPVFITLTLPPEYHLHPRRGEPGDPRTSPSDGAREIGNRWHKALCMVRERGVRPFGLRVAEPHADGTVHLHCVLWVPTTGIRDLCDCLSTHFPPTTAKEEKARRSGDYTKGPAILIKEWEEREDGDDRGAADPASYALCYVLDVLGDPKDGGSGEDDAFVEEARKLKKRRKDKNSERVGAWARNARLRRISLIGLAPGTIGRWEALYRMMKKADFGGTGIAEPRARATVHAMRRKQWGTVLRLLGAFSAEPRFKALREQRENCWGDLIKVTAAYYHPRTREISALVRSNEWMIKHKDELQKSENHRLSVIDSYPRAAPGAPPRAGPEGSCA